MATSIVFIDSRITSYQSLIDSLTEPAEVFVLDGTSDGLTQIATYLQGRTGIEAIHVISHGSQGALYLGSSVLNSGNLASYQSQLSKIGGALTETGDILLYGCNVAQGDVGVRFITSLAQYTGADLAASSNVTGARTQGGDWLLERVIGSIEALAMAGNSLVEVLSANTAPTFGDGKLTTAFGTDSIAYSSAVQADGRILAAGYSYTARDSGDFALVRYAADGSLDNSFGTGGRVTTNFGGSSYDVGYSLVIQPDSKIIIAGNSDGKFALARYNADGSLDRSFDANGTATTIVLNGYTSEARSVALQANGKIVVGGSAVYRAPGSVFALARYNIDGSLDTSFDTDGIVTTDVGTQSDFGQSITIQADDKIILAGFTTNLNQFALVRYNPDGSLDTGFGIGGKVISFFGSNNDTGNSVVLQSDGKILVAGAHNGQSSNNDFTVVRYNTDGSLDTSFGIGGKVITESTANDIGNSIALQADGKILVAGTSGRLLALVRYTADGSLDTSFDTDGKVTALIGSAENASIVTSGQSVSLQSDGKILVAGSSNPNNISVREFALARFNVDGSLDTTFNPYHTTNGTASFTEGSSATVLDTDVQATDLELATLNGGLGNYSGASLTLARHGGASSQDVFSASGTLSFASGFVTIGGSAIGTASNAAGTLTLSFFDGTQAQINSVMRQIAYSNTSDAPPVTAQIDWTFSDGNTGSQGIGGALSTTGSTTVSVTSVNDAPIATAGSVATVENTTYTFSSSNFPFNDPDAGSALAKIKIVSLPASGSLILNGAAVVSGMEISPSVISLGLLTYVPAANANGQKTFSFALNDGFVYGPSALMTISIANGTPPSATYSLTTNSTATNEGSSVISTLSTTNVAAGTTLYYQIAGSGITTADFGGLALTGSGVVNASGQIALTIPIASDLTTEGGETFYLQYYTDSARSISAGSAAGVTINDTSITPALLQKTWTRLLGTSGAEDARALTTGLDGSIYVSGYTTGSFDGQTNSGGYDAFLTKYGADGTKGWTKLLGTSTTDQAHALTTGLDGSIYVSGYTGGSLDGQTYSGGSDAFLTKYNADGTKAWTRLMGTSGDEYAEALTTGLDGSIYVSGSTNGSLDGQTNSGYYEVFLTKYNPDGSKAWTKLLGGSAGGVDQAHALTTGIDGSIYVSGFTDGSIDGLTKSGGVRDAFLTRYNADGTKIWTRLLGTSGDEWAEALTTGLDGSVYVSGYATGSLDGQTSSGGEDAFLTKFSSDGTKAWTKLLGTSTTDQALALTTGLDGSIYVSGFTGGPLDGQIFSDVYDAFLTKYSTDGTKAWTTLLGTSGFDIAEALTTGLDGSIYVSGYTAGSLDGQTNSGGDDVFLTKYSESATSTPSYSVNTSSTSVNEGTTATFTLTTTNVASGISVPYTLSGISAADITGGLLTGTATVNASGTSTISVPLASDLLTEGAETLTVTAGGASASTTVNDTSTTPLANYAISAGSTAVDEGAVATFTLTTTNVAAGTSVSYTLSGVSAADITGGALSGTATVSANGTATILVPVAADSLTEGTETLTVTVLGKTASIAINDSSKGAATYALSTASASVDEGSIATFSLQTTNVGAGTSIGYTITGVSSADVTGGLSGTATVDTSGLATISVPIAVDFTTEGAETLTVTAQGKSAFITVNDTSKAAVVPSYALSAASTSVDEGSSAVFTLTTTNVAGGTSIPYTVTGVSAADVTGGALSGTAIVNSSGTATISIPVAADVTTEGAETLTVTAQGKSAAIAVNDTSKAPTTTAPTVTGTANDDTIANTVGSKSIDGGSGKDTLKYTNSSAAFVINQVAGATVVTNTATGDVDTLSNVERLTFADQSVALDMGAAEPAGATALLLGAVLGRDLMLSKKELLGAVIDLFDQGYTLQQLSGAVMRLPIWDVLTGKTVPTNADIANYLLTTVNGSAPSASLLASSAAALNNETFPTQGSLLASLAASPANVLSVRLAELSASGLPFTVPPPTPTYSLLAGSASVNEGAVAGFTLNTTNVTAGTSIAYVITGVSETDIAGGQLSGTAIVNTSGVATINVSIAGDSSTEGVETLTVTAQGASASVLINDTSVAPLPTYSLLAGSASVNEGSVATFTLNTTNVAAGTSIGYTISGVSSADILGGQLSGTDIVNSSGVATITVPIAADSLTEGTEVLTITVQNASASISLNDTSTTPVAVPTYSLAPNTASMNEGSVAGFTLRTSNLATGTSVAYVLAGLSSADIVGGVLSGSVLTDANGMATIAVQIAADTLTEGSETLIVSAQGASASMLINDTSTTPVVPTYSLAQNSTSVDEGSIAGFTLRTTNVANGTSIGYTISGLTAADITGGLLNGSVIIDSNGMATIAVSIIADKFTEGTETLTVAGQGFSASMTVLDTSITIIGVPDGGGDGGGGGGGGGGGVG